MAGILGGIAGAIGNTLGGGAAGAGTDPALTNAQQDFTHAQDALLINQMNFSLQQQASQLQFQQFQSKQQTALDEEHQLTALSDKASQLVSTQLNQDIQHIGQ